MKVIVLCESSAVVRDAFRARGHDAYSCDLLPCDGDPRWHIQGDAREVMLLGWDLGIMHPPCTHLASSGARWFPQKRADGRQQEAIEFAKALWNAPIPRIALENPIGILSTEIRKPDQIIQPWQFGHMESKATCLWLRGLMLLRETANVRNEMMELPRRERERECTSSRQLRTAGNCEARRTAASRTPWPRNGDDHMTATTLHTELTERARPIIADTAADAGIKVGVSLLQRRLGIGYADAKRVLDTLAAEHPDSVAWARIHRERCEGGR